MSESPKPVSPSVWKKMSLEERKRSNRKFREWQKKKQEESKSAGARAAVKGVKVGSINDLLKKKKKGRARSKISAGIKVSKTKRKKGIGRILFDIATSTK